MAHVLGAAPSAQLAVSNMSRRIETTEITRTSDHVGRVEWGLP